jgi:hypothetical protein
MDNFHDLLSGKKRFLEIQLCGKKQEEWRPEEIQFIERQFGTTP